MKRSFAAFVVALALLWAAPVFADHAMTNDGAVHTVRSEHFSSPQGEEGSLLLHRRQLADGTTAQDGIEGTTDLAPDLSPALVVTGDGVVLVWSRDDGDGIDLYISEWCAESSWHEPRLLISRSADTLSPALSYDGRLIHVIWREELGEQSSWMRLSLHGRNLQPVFGPELLPGPEGNESLVPPAGEDATSDEPTPDRSYMAGEYRMPGEESGAIFVWGIRDEPVPIDFRRGFELPRDVEQVTDLQAKWLGGQLTLTYVHDKALHYSAYQDGQWTDQRVILLDGNLSADAARQLILENAEATNQAAEAAESAGSDD